MLKYSRQREAIKTFLAGRYDHPTAETAVSYTHLDVYKRQILNGPNPLVGKRPK